MCFIHEILLLRVYAHCCSYYYYIIILYYCECHFSFRIVFRLHVWSGRHDYQLVDIHTIGPLEDVAWHQSCGLEAGCVQVDHTTTMDMVDVLYGD